MSYSRYYQAQIVEQECWYLVAVMRSFEHLVFDRTYDKETSTFEFFVPEELERYFLEIMNYFVKEGIVLRFTLLPNRLSDPDEVV